MILLIIVMCQEQHLSQSCRECGMSPIIAQSNDHGLVVQNEMATIAATETPSQTVNYRQGKVHRHNIFKAPKMSERHDQFDYG